VADALKEKILDGRLVPGQRLIANDLLEELGVSRGSLREAFRQLEAERLIDLSPNRGAIVRKLNPSEVDKLFEIRIALEGYAARAAAERINEKDNRQRFQQILEQGRSHLDNPVFASFIVDNRAFHQAIVSMSGNDELARLIDKYQLPVFMLQLRQIISKEQIIQNALKEHEDIAAGILSGHPEAAYRAMKQHLLHSSELIIQSL
jgi:DNA-binding GntR family transcriptional regulator